MTQGRDMTPEQNKVIQSIVEDVASQQAMPDDGLLISIRKDIEALIRDAVAVERTEIATLLDKRAASVDENADPVFLLANLATEIRER
jgi:hypothetical protein